MRRLMQFLTPWRYDHGREVADTAEREKVAERAAKDIKKGGAIMGGVVVAGLFVSAAIGAYIFFGLVMLLGFVVLVESTPPVRWLVERSNKVVDWALFGLTLYASVTLGVTVMASMTVAGLGYTLLYAPYLRGRHAKRIKKAKTS